jgi:hypothetical protein
MPQLIHPIHPACILQIQQSIISIYSHPSCLLLAYLRPPTPALGRTQYYQYNLSRIRSP